eukprot:243736-Prorocentrum_minimum.AAC.1
MVHARLRGARAGGHSGGSVRRAAAAARRPGPVEGGARGNAQMIGAATGFGDLGAKRGPCGSPP